MRKVALALAAAVAAQFLLIAPAEAGPTLLINGSGQLTGANGVVIGSSVYDVAFEDGTCASIFGDCTSSSNFNFTTFSQAASASQALLDQVFVDSGSGQFDTNPALTFGCSDPDGCFVTMPYETFSGGFYAEEAWNTPTTDFGNVSLTVTGDFDSRNYDDHVYAFFSYVGPYVAGVPEPASWAMMLLGFAGIGLAMRRKAAAALA